MQPEPNLNRMGVDSDDQDGSIICAQCGAPMPEGMRFCRTCGQRLGEGPAEYTETVRLPTGTAPSSSRATTQFVPGYAPPLAQAGVTGFLARQRRRFSGMTWVFIFIAIFFGVGGLLSTFMRAPRRPPIVRTAPSRSYLGVGDLENANGGVTFNAVDAPGSAIDKAGLVGGDIITSFDGRGVKDEDDLMEALQRTPIGKTVEVVYIRDGETKKTQLTTMSRENYEGLKEAFADRPEGQGRFGFDDDDVESVPIAGMSIRGVKLGDISPNLPADMAGIKEGDIVIEFDDVPIRTGSELAFRVRRVIPYSTVNVAVIRNGQRLDIPVKLGKR